MPRRNHAETVDAIGAAAFRIADTDGLDALSMRRLGRAVGLDAATLYHYVAGRDAVLDEVVRRLRAQVHIPDPLPGSWQAALEAVFTAYAEVLVNHPHLVQLAGRQVAGDPEVNGLAALVGLGLDRDAATALWQSVLALTVGFALLASRAVPLGSADIDDPALAERLAEWRLADYRTAVRALIDAAGTAAS
ncbi:MAG: TetR/AcrR family transcriptional regulator [Propionibacteriaceae bacterium]|nr:TetR/AcrR family transcriptional regulator [Propionibacteriaceae bacterium]